MTDNEGRNKPCLNPISRLTTPGCSAMGPSCGMDGRRPSNVRVTETPNTKNALLQLRVQAGFVLSAHEARGPSRVWRDTGPKPTSALLRAGHPASNDNKHAWGSEHVARHRGRS